LDIDMKPHRWQDKEFREDITTFIRCILFNLVIFVCFFVILLAIAPDDEFWLIDKVRELLDIN